MSNKAGLCITAELTQIIWTVSMHAHRLDRQLSDTVSMHAHRLDRQLSGVSTALEFIQIILNHSINLRGLKRISRRPHFPSVELATSLFIQMKLG